MHFSLSLGVEKRNAISSGRQGIFLGMELKEQEQAVISVLSGIC